jgi:carbonic anhydrase
MTNLLLKGFKKFRKEVYESSSLMKRLIEDGQAPDYFIISCIDSRSNPGTIFRPEPGTFFAHKAMGAIVRPYKKGTALAAALQFALIHNKVKEIIVLGHTGCGAIKAMVEKIDDEEISSFINVAQEGVEKAKATCGNSCTHDELLRHTEEEIVLLSAENLRSYPSVAKALEENRVAIKPWLFEMETGNLLQYNYDFKEFVPLTSHAVHTKTRRSTKGAKT